MKKITIVLFVVFCSTFAIAQTQFGLKIGLNSEQIAIEDLIITNAAGKDALNLKIKNANYGFHFGALMQARVGRIYIAPEVLFNSNKVNYTLKGIGIAAADSLRSETYRNLDIPILVGMKFGPAIAKAGVVSHLHLEGKSDLTTVNGFNAAYTKATWGYQVGLSIPLGDHLQFDVRYEGNLAQFGNHLNFNGKQYMFDQRAKRVQFSAAYRF